MNNIARKESMTLPCDPTAPAVARRFARRVVPLATLDTVELLVSELVTNAVIHAGSEVELTICDLGDRFRVEVSDLSPLVPALRTPNVAGGRGLQLVQMLAARWGSEPTKTGKTVWFEIPCADVDRLAIPGRPGAVTPANSRNGLRGVSSS